MSAQYQLGCRTFHSTEVLGGDLFLWGGGQEGLPEVHDNEEKRSITTKVDVFSLSTLEWTKTATTGTPPAGVKNYGTALIGQDMFVFGGRCNLGKCSHNELYALNTNSKVWRKIPCTDGPLEKYSCGFISYSYQGTDYLLALGGKAGKRPTQQQQHSLYILYGGSYITNEIHTMEMTSSQGKWNVPIIKGERPPPLAFFTLNVLPNDRSKAILFGGKIVPEKDQSHYSADLYLLTLSSDTVEFIKLSPQLMLEWPKPRFYHSSTVIKSYINDKEQSYLLVMGGDGTDYRTRADCWIMNLSLNKWNKIDLPQSVCGRRTHSLSSVTMKKNTEWLIITGGEGMGCIRGVDVTVIVEIEYVSGQWVVHGVWNSTQKEELTERMKELRPERTERNEEEMAHLQQEIQRLTIQLTDSQKEMKKVRSDSHQLIQRAQQETRQAQRIRKELTEQVEQKDEVIHQTRLQIQTLQNNITANEKQIAQSAHQMQFLQNNLTVKDRIIQRNETTIANLEQEMTHYRDTPSWLIEREEVLMTDEVLGIGGWGEVKVGIFRGTRVAVKCLHQLIVSEYYLQLFSREMDIASRVRHPNLLQFIGATRVGNPIIVTELMPTSLRKELEKCPMTKPQVISIGIDITLALNYLHLWKPQPILHRDVSSANVLLEPSARGKWKAKLSDYGSANLQENVHTESPGCPVYSAPEATTPKLHSPAMDIYSVGVLLVEMATGKFPSSVSHGRDAQIRKVMWPLLKELIYRCTDDNAKSRPSSRVLLEELKKQL